MNETQKRSMIIHFNDGSKKLLEFPAPVPKKLPAYAIRGVTFKD